MVDAGGNSHFSSVHLHQHRSGAFPVYIVPRLRLSARAEVHALAAHHWHRMFA